MTDRFATVAAVLGGFDEGHLSPAAPANWMECLQRAGVHPASLLFCGTVGDLRRLEPLDGLLVRLGPAWERVPAISHDTIVAWSPLTYAHEIEGWALRTAARPGGVDAVLPDDLLALRPVTVEDDPRVLRLGRGWAVVGRLRLQDLPRLGVLDGPLEVFGDLELEGLPALARLEAGIRVHGNLTVARCPGLAALPEDLEVDGALWFDVLPAGFRPGRPARVIACPWPGLAPAPVAIGAYPPGVLQLAGREPAR